MWIADSLEKTLIQGKTEGRRRRGWQRMRWLEDMTNSMDMNPGKLWETVRNRGAWSAAVHGVTKSRTPLGHLNNKQRKILKVQRFLNSKTLTGTQKLVGTMLTHWVVPTVPGFKTNPHRVFQWLLPRFQNKHTRLFGLQRASLYTAGESGGDGRSWAPSVSNLHQRFKS